MTASWWGKEEELSYEQLLLNPDENDSDQETAVVGKLVLIPPSRHFSALCRWQHIPDLDTVSSHCLGGLALLLRAACRENHPKTGTSSRFYLVGGVGWVFVVGSIVMLNILLPKSVSQSGAWSVAQFALYCIFAFFLLDPMANRAQQQSQDHQEALAKFHTESEERVREWSNVLQSHGYRLSCDIMDEDLSSGGRITVTLERNRNEGHSLSLPDVSAEFLNRETPLDEMLADLALLGLLVKGVPIDEWTYGGLMVHLYRSHKQMLAQSYRSYIVWSLAAIYLLACVGMGFVFYRWIGDVMLAVILALWIVSPIMLCVCGLVIRYCDERLYYDEKHRFFRDAVSQVSAVSEQRHGQALYYEVLPGWLPNTTKGMIRFVPSVPVDASIV